MQMFISDKREELEKEKREKQCTEKSFSEYVRR